MNFSDVDEESSSQHADSTSTKTGLTSLGTSTVYSLIETSHPVFGKVKRLWNSPMESHREVSKIMIQLINQYLDSNDLLLSMCT